MLLSGWQQRLPLQAGKPGRKWSSGRLCQLDSYSTSWWPVVGLPRWLFPWRHRQCISAKIEHNSNRCHGEMYFDIVLVYSTKGRKRPPRDQQTRQQQRRRGGGTSHAALQANPAKGWCAFFWQQTINPPEEMKSLKATLKLGSSSNRYAPRLPRRETKSSTKQLTPTDPILGPEKLLKPASLKRASLVLQSSWQRNQNWSHSASQAILSSPKICFQVFDEREGMSWLCEVWWLTPTQTGPASLWNPGGLGQ